MTIPNGSTGLTCANGPLSHKRPSLVHLDPTLLLWTLASAKLFGVLLLNFWIDKHSDGDIKQMAIYAAKRGAKKLYLLYPLHRDEEPETIEIHYNINLGREFGERKIPLHILKVPFAFAEDEEATRALLKRILIEVPA